jgi:hypothetical protein
LGHARLFHECQQISAAKSALSPPAYTKAWQQAVIRPSAEGCLAHVQKLGGFADVEESDRVSRVAFTGIHPIVGSRRQTRSRVPGLYFHSSSLSMLSNNCIEETSQRSG